MTRWDETDANAGDAPPLSEEPPWPRRSTVTPSRQQQQAGAEDVPPAGAAARLPTAGGLSEDKMTRLRELGELHEQKVLTDEEFEREKAKLLEG